jgi:hypothetical protein
MIDAIRRGLSGLVTFSGRDDRRTFWYYVLFVFILRWLAGTAASIVLMGSVVSRSVRSAVSGGGAEATVRTMQADVAAIMPQMAMIGIVVGLLTMALLAAALVRRLHDSNLPGGLVLVPGALYLVVIATMPEQTERAMLAINGSTDHPGETVLAHTNWGLAALGWAAIAIVVALGVRKSTPGANRYGRGRDSVF